MITTRAGLEECLASVATRCVKTPGLDLEADNLHRYAEQLCLIQITDGERVHLVDPLLIEDLDPLKRFLAGHEIWMHGADFDMTLMKREFGVLPRRIYDTQIAARLLGIRSFSYANLVEQFFEVRLCKASQKANWGRRPLPEKMARYAENDVRYLLPLAEKLEAGLREKERFDWFVETCDSAMERVLERDDTREEPWRIRGAGKLGRRALCFLKALWEWRDREAREWDRPPFMVVRNQLLTEWSESLSNGGKLDVPRNVRGARAERLWQAVEAAREVAEGDWPERRRRRSRRWDRADEKRYEALASRRDQAARTLDIESSMIAPRSALEEIAFEADPGDHLLDWQRRLLEL